MNAKRNPCGKPECGEETKVCCEKRYDSSCVYYHTCTTTPSNLRCLNIKNGASLETILEKIDAKLCSSIIQTNNWNLPCLRNTYHYAITDLKSFTEAVDDRLCKQKAEIINEIINNQTLITQLVTKILNNQTFINTVINIVQNNCCDHHEEECDVNITVSAASCNDAPPTL